MSVNILTEEKHFRPTCLFSVRKDIGNLGLFEKVQMKVCPGKWFVRDCSTRGVLDTLGLGYDYSI